MPKAVYNGTVVAESDDTIVVEGNHYFPPESVDESLLAESDRHTVCGWKGTASYKDLVVDGDSADNAVWYYPEPKDAASEIAGYYAFDRRVTVQQ